MQERIEPLPNSGTAIRLIDGTALTLGSDADLTIDELVFDPATKRGSSVLKLGTGTFYYVSGQMNREDIAIQTLSTTIGIRGTQLLITVAADGATAVGVVRGAARRGSRLSGETTLADVG
ncbi:MAG: FecR domain-containing protein, partial [Rickettsiales bacterium]